MIIHASVYRHLFSVIIYREFVDQNCSSLHRTFCCSCCSCCCFTPVNFISVSLSPGSLPIQSRYSSPGFLCSPFWLLLKTGEDIQSNPIQSKPLGHNNPILLVGSSLSKPSFTSLSSGRFLTFRVPRPLFPSSARPPRPEWMDGSLTRYLPRKRRSWWMDRLLRHPGPRFQ